MKIQRPRGTFDILPDEAARWNYTEGVVRRVAHLYGYGEIRTPIFESTDLFVRSVGESTDIVSREMYTFKDRGGRLITLRPEGTAPVIRAYLENSLNKRDKHIRLYYLGPIFRYEKPQAGRFRQHHQFGVEAIGVGEPAQDAEIVEMIIHLYSELGLKNLTAAINSVGCRVCRPGYNRLLREYLDGKSKALCEECGRRAKKNPLRVFDCKNDICGAVLNSAPKVVENLCDSCRHHFETVKGYLDNAGIGYQVEPRLVRGLDYYTRTTFEILSEELGAQNAVGGGGRYDDLIEMLGGPPTPAIGFGTGLERIIMLLRERRAGIPGEAGPRLYVAVWERECVVAAEKVLRIARGSGIPAEADFSMSSLKSQLRRANKRGARYVALLGKNEVDRGRARIKDMTTGGEKEVELERIAEEIK